MKIGMFDSGIGGLTLLKEALRQLPDEEYHYYADTDHVPYGEHSVEEIRAYSDEAAGFLLGKGCDAIVVACNTATSAAVGMLREKYKVPVIGIEPAVKPALKLREDKRILVIATPVTVREKKLHDLIEREDIRHRVDMLALPGLVGFAEKGDFASPGVKEYLDKEFGEIDTSRYSVLVLGCTHFNHFQDILKSYFENDICITDGKEGTIRHLENVLREKGCISEGKCSISYYESGREVRDKERLDFYDMLMKHLEKVQDKG
ncbi:MAG: glutamate racemase [Lachnospiraceae bacterium]|nr:glutamate racemase [Lachnospiraceae bacterium]